MAQLHRELGVSEYWARQVCGGRKVPSLEFLHGLVRFFRVDGGEAFFTASADEALDGPPHPARVPGLPARYSLLRDAPGLR
ncbi:hypothetical protein AB0O01_24480 [Streptomyces sp. NPDC093252]|uniref:hypothetical protein n=1 Tax=Streptomyces sp. NPDC093252 TaxID=3154980 RepID=UPI0034147DC4